MENECDGDTNCNLHTRNGPQRRGKKAERIGNWGINQDHPNYCTVEIGQITEKSPVDQWRFAVTKTQVKDHQQTLKWRIIIIIIIIIIFLGNCLEYCSSSSSSNNNNISWELCK